MYIPATYIPVSNYPLFEPNQVLTDTQLNQMREFLDQQNRFTRTNLVGVGIVCGLHAQARGDKASQTMEIQLTAGYGISTLGHLMVLEKDTRFTRCRIYEGFSEDGVPQGYQKWADYDALELLTTEEGDKLSKGARKTAGAKKEAGKVYELSGQDLEKKVLLLYLEKKQAGFQPCVKTDCNQAANNMEITPRLLLIPMDKLRPVDACEVLSDQLIRVPRLHTVAEPMRGYKKEKHAEQPGCPLALIESGEHLNMTYGKIVEGMYPIFETCLEDLFRDCRTFLGVDLTDDEVDELIECLKQQIYTRPDPMYDQYHYDYVRDLAETYNELKTILCRLGPEKSCFFRNTFPCHLYLRAFVDDGTGYRYQDVAGYRHHFVASPARGALHGEWEKARRLMLRIVAMIRYFCPVAEGYKYSQNPPIERDFPIRITLSQTSRSLLGERAVPYYYELASGSSNYTAFLESWPCSACCQPIPMLAYYDEELDHQPDLPARLEGVQNKRMFPVPYQHHSMHYDIGAFNFYRIEGHVGWNCHEAEKEVNRLKKLYNLDFDVLVVHMQDTAGEEQDVQDELERAVEKNRSVFKEYWETNVIIDKASIQDFVSKAQAINAHLKAEKNIDSDVFKYYDSWKSRRRRRDLHCGISWLRHDFAQHRNELCSLLNQIQEKISVDDKIFEVAIQKATLNQLDNATIQQLWEYELNQYIDNLKECWLTEDLFDFNFRVFIQKYKDIIQIACKILLGRKLGNGWNTPSRNEYADFPSKLTGNITLKDTPPAPGVDLSSSARGVEAYLNASEAIHTLLDSSEAFGIPELSKSITVIEEVLKPEVAISEYTASISAKDNRMISYLGKRLNVKDNLFSCLLSFFQSSLFQSLATAYYTLEYIRAHDVSLFSHLARHVCGMEHHAGVQPCGTFIMICDPECQPEGEPVIVADFSVCGKLDCCCEIDPAEIYKPVIALPDYKVVETDLNHPSGFTTEIFQLRNNDIFYQYPFDKEGSVEKLKVELLSPYSRNGHSIELIPGEDNPTVRYKINHDKVFKHGQAEEKDYFEYRL
ncbi:MAG: hypothetical protein D6730_20605, partial [Bacteroidetes bacterium]